MAVQWLRLHTSNAEGMGLKPGQERSHMPRGEAKKKKKKMKEVQGVGDVCIPRADSC